MTGTETAAQTRGGTAGYRLVVPGRWFAVDLDSGRRERAVAALVERQFAGVDNAPHLKAQARQELLAKAGAAYAAGGLEMFLSHAAGRGDTAGRLAGDFHRIPARAMAKVEAFGEHSVTGSLTMAKMREIFEQPDELSFGETEMTETDVPAGSALRVHRFRKAEPGKRRSPIGEELVWIIWPPGSTAIVSMATRWMEPMFSKAGISIADDMANNFRIEPKA